MMEPALIIKDNIPVYLIEDSDSLVELNASFQHLDPLQTAVDLEGEYNLHRYGTHLCLVQIATPTGCYLVDVLKISDLSPLKEFFQGSIQKIMFDPNGDILLLDQCCSIHPQNIYDIQAAAKLLGSQNLSLNTVISDFLQITPNRSKRYQRANWSIRPIKPNLLEYAANDVRYLIPLKNLMEPQLSPPQIKSLNNHNRKLAAVRFAEKPNPHLRTKGAGRLTPNQKIFLRHFYTARDEIARHLDLPPNSLLNNKTLLNISITPPTTIRQWNNLPGFHPRGKRYINRFLRSFETARQEVDKKKPPGDPH